MYKPLTADLVYFSPRNMDGFSSSGIWCQLSEYVPQVCGDVTKVHPDCKIVRKGDIIFFYEYAFEATVSRETVHYSVRTNRIYMIVREDAGPKPIGLGWKV